MKLRLFSFPILMFALFLAGCQKKDVSPPSHLRINFQEGDLPSLHPHEIMIYLRGICLAKNLYEGLTRINSHGAAELAGAKSVQISPDRLKYVFTLRSNRWSDGSPVTAFQYEQAWKEALTPASSCPRADLLYMIKNAAEAKKGTVPVSSVGVKATDEKTLVVDLAYPSPYFMELLAQPICAPLKDLKKEPTVYNGAYVIDTWKKEDYLRLKPNPYFWNSKETALKQIDIFFIQDIESAYSLYEKGELDWIGAPLCTLSNDQMDHINAQGTLLTHPIDRAFWVFLNTQHPTLSSPSIRKALSAAIDRSAITSHILLGRKPLTKPLPQGLLPLDGHSTIKEDIQLAQALFEEGLKEIGHTKESLPPLVITYSQQANRKQLAEYLQETWSKTFGIKVRAQPEEWNVLRSNLGKGLFEISGCFEAAFYNDPLELFDRFTSYNPCNFCQWIHPIFGEKIAQAIQEKDPKRRMQLTSEAEDIIVQESPFIPICSDMLFFAHPPKLKGYAFDYVGAVDFSKASFSK